MSASTHKSLFLYFYNTRISILYANWCLRAGIECCCFRPSGVCWWLKEGWGPVDVFSMVGNIPVDIRIYRNFVSVTAHGMYLPSTPLPSPPSLSWEGHGGMVLKRMNGKEESRENWLKPSFHYPSLRPELTGDRFPLPVNTSRVDGCAFPLAELTGRVVNG